MPVKNKPPAPWHPSIDLTAWQEAEINPHVIIADGSEIHVSVRARHLCIEDGPLDSRRTRKFSRVSREVSRLMILGGHGFITIEAQRWLNTATIPWVVLDCHDDNDIVATSGPTRQDARLLRAQSRADNEPYGLEITRYLLHVKLTGQADILDEYFPDSGSTFIRGRLRALESAKTIRECMVWEGMSAENYWQAWKGNTPVPFSREDEQRIPKHWLNFTQRASLAYETIRNRAASDPVNACLNYLYRIAESECVHALYSLGLSPILGIAHTDKPNRDSLALDLLETIRPFCDRILLNLFGTGEKFDRRWLIESDNGVVRLRTPLTHKLCSYAPDIAKELAPHAQYVAEILARNSAGYPKAPPYKGKPVGYPAARLRPNVSTRDLIPDKLWERIAPLLPARSTMGRPNAVSDRDMVAALVARYMLKVPWNQALRGSIHRSTVSDRLHRWRKEWPQIVEILVSNGHLPGLIKE